MTGDVCCADCLHSFHGYHNAHGEIWEWGWDRRRYPAGLTEGWWCELIDVSRNPVTGKRGVHPCKALNADGKCVRYETNKRTSTSIWYKPWTWGTGYWGNPPEMPAESLRVPDGVDADGQPYYAPENKT